MATRTARTAWNGNLAEGSGQVELTTSGLGTFDVSWGKRIDEGTPAGTSPEELVAAAHSSCFAMQLSALLAEAGGTPVALQVTADVDFAPDPAGGWRIPRIRLTLRGEVEGIDEDTFLKTAEKAKETCPVSKALTGTTITLDAALD
jgi:lipoyl-dependent peroxiredoxin